MIMGPEHHGTASLLAGDTQISTSQISPEVRQGRDGAAKFISVS